MMRRGSAVQRHLSTVSSASSSHARVHHSVTPKDATAYTIRPNFQKKFRPVIVKAVIHEVLMEVLADKDYDKEMVSLWTNQVSAAIVERLKELELDRYKFIVQVFIGEQKGAGAKMLSRCLWDSDTDSQAQDLFINGSMFCVAIVYGVFYY